MTDFWQMARSNVKQRHILPVWAECGMLCLIIVFSMDASITILSAAPDVNASETKTVSQENTPVLGDQANTVRSLVISGNNSFSEQQIRGLMLTDVWGVYDERVLKSDFKAIIRFYKENGYQFARIAEEALSVKKFGDGIYLGIEIDEGTIGKIIVSGNIHTKEDVVRHELLFTEGDVYTEADREESEQILRRKTYIGAAKIDAQWDELSKTGYGSYDYQGALVVSTWCRFEPKQSEKILDAAISRSEHVWVGSKYVMALREN